MSVPEMDLFRFLKLISVYIVAALVVSTLNSVESRIYIHFDQTPLPFSRFSTAIFGYSVKRLDGSNACAKHSCLIYCELDGKALESCPVGVIALRNLTENRKHQFLVNVTTRNGETNSSAFSWFIDTTPPTATISSDQNYTNAEKITIEITFTEACTREGAFFKCLNSSNCDVIARGPGHIHASSLRVIEPKIKYRLDVILSLKTLHGRVMINTKDRFCIDLAGNRFTRTNSSILVIHFDRRPVLADLWTSVPSYELGINGVPRTVFAINKINEIKIFLDFSIPVVNSTEQIINLAHVNSGEIVSIRDRNHGNRRFVFALKNIPVTKIITVELQASLIIGKTGTPVSPVSPLIFLYDSTKPAVGLSTSSPSITKEPNINVIVEFTKPVFGFEASMVEVDGGRLTRFEELSRALYSLTVMAVAENVVSITVPAGKVNDISGNPNLVSNRLEVKHYLTPEISIALHSFITAGVLATSLAAVILSLSSANLEAIGTLSSTQTNIIAADPSTNLYGMVGHLQVFVLSNWILANQSIEYSETARGLRWLIPHQRLPWKRNSTSNWPNHFYDVTDEITKLSNFSLNFPSKERYHHRTDLNFSKYSSYRVDEPHTPIKTHPKPGWLHELQNKSMESTYGLPLNLNEYLTYFLRGEPLSASNVIKKMENYKGWEDLEMNLFWLGLGGGSLLIIHAGLLLFLRWRTKKPAFGILSVPRFELFLFILMLPCISQSSAFVIRGGTMWGIIIGTFLLAIPAAFILSVFLFLIIAIFFSSFAQYKELKDVGREEPWYTKLCFFIWGRAATGKWFYREGLPSSFLPRFGILYENQKGPTLFVFVDQNNPNTIPRWTGSSQSEIGRMKAISSDDSNEEIEIPLSRRIFGCARSSYIILDLIRRVSLGIIAGAYSSHHLSQSLFAFTITLIQFMYLLILRPHIRRGVHMVESISLMCEAGLFGLSISMDVSNLIKARTQGFLMLALLFITFLVQIINEWYALVQCLLRFSYPEMNSFFHGLTIAAKGVVLPFLPRKHLARVIPSSWQPKTGLTPVLPLCPETEFEQRDIRAPCFGSFSSMSTTVVPVLGPAGSPGIDVLQATDPLTTERAFTSQRAVEVKQAKGPEQKSEMKKLRELARASFSGDSKG